MYIKIIYRTRSFLTLGVKVFLPSVTLGSEDFVRRGVEDKMTKIEEITALLPNMQDHAVAMASHCNSNLHDHLHQLAASAALNPSKEKRFLLSDQDRRPADVFIPNWAAGLDAALDVMVVNLLQVAPFSRRDPGGLAPCGGAQCLTIRTI